MPSGNVEFLGAVVGSAAFGGHETTKAFDGDYSTDFAQTDAIGYVGYDFGGAGVTITRISLAARQETYAGAVPFQDQSQYWIIRVGDLAPSGDGSNLTTIDRFDDTDLSGYYHKSEWVYHNQRNSIGINPNLTPGRYCIVQLTNSSGGAISEIVMEGPYVIGPGCRPVLPTIAGDRFTQDSTVITLSSRTTSASLYYTLDGTTPTTASTLYTKPFRLAPGSCGTTIKVLADDATCSTRSSIIASATLYRAGLRPKFDLKDDRDLLIEAHGGGIFTDKANYPSTYFWHGFSMNRSHSGDSEYGSAAMQYTSSDLKNWTYSGPMFSLKTFGLSGLNPTNIQRPHLIGKHPTTGKYVCWVSAGDGYPAAGANCLTADSPSGPWTLAKSALAPNGRAYKDGTCIALSNGDAYLVYNASALSDGIWFTKLNSTWTDVTATEFKLAWAGVSGFREAPIAFEREGNIFLVTSDSSFYDNTVHWFTRFRVCTGLDPTVSGNWSAAPGADNIFPTDPQGTVFNGQCSHIFKALTAHEQFILITDAWTGPGSVGDLYASRQVWHRLNFTSATAFNLARFEYDWDPTPRPRHYRGVAA